MKRGPRTGWGASGQIRIKNERHIRRRKKAEFRENDEFMALHNSAPPWGPFGRGFPLHLHYHLWNDVFIVVKLFLMNIKFNKIDSVDFIMIFVFF